MCFSQHEDYNCFTCPGAFPHDIAILYLERATTLNEFVQPAILASPENDAAYESSVCYSSGWGKLGQFTGLLECHIHTRITLYRVTTYRHCLYVQTI